MRVEINGKVKEVPNGISLQKLLEDLSLPQQRVAVELDHRVIRKIDWPLTLVNDGARIEVVHFVGGG
jgi:sulfur carrier protein